MSRRFTRHTRSTRRFIGFETLETRALLAMDGLSPVNSFYTVEESSLSSGTNDKSDSTYLGEFTDDPGYQYSVTLSWGRDSDLVTIPNSVKPAPDGNFEVTIPDHTYAEEGQYDINATVVRSDSSDSCVLTGKAYVSDAPLTGTGLTVHATEGTPLNNEEVVTFIDGNADAPTTDFLAFIDWGDGGGTTPGVIDDKGDGVFSVSGSYTYAEEGPNPPDYTYTTTVWIYDAGGTTITVNGTAKVDDAPLTNPAAQAFTATEGTAYTGVVATFQDTVNTEPLESYAATIDWGDGTQSPGVIGGGLGSYTVTGTHTYADEGSYAVITTIDDDGGSSIQVGSADTVLDASFTLTTPTQVSASAGQPVTVEFTINDTNGLSDPNDFSVTIDWGGGSSPTEVLTPPGLDFSLTYTYDVAGTYTVYFTVNEDGAGGGSQVVSFEMDVT